MKAFLIVAITALVNYDASSFEFNAAPVCEPGVEFYPHPTDCNKYYQCSEGIAIEQECPPDLYWNPVLNVCDFPLPSGCKITTDQTTVSTTPTTATSTSSTSPTATTELPTEGSSTSELPTEGSSTSELPTEGSSTSELPTEGSSTTGIPTEGSSTTGLPTEGSSTTGISTETTSGSSTSQQPSTEPPGGLPDSCPAVDDPNHVIRLPHETNCEFYYRCTNGTALLYGCSLTGDLHFSPTLRKCQPVDEAGCDRCPPVEDVDHVVRLPHETDCHLYYMCSAGVKVLYQCREDWQFSRDVRECLTQDEAKCNL